MVKKKEEKEVFRLSFGVGKDLHKRAEKMPWGVRSIVLRVLLEKVLDSVDKHGTVMYGAMMDGSFDLVHKEKEEQKDG